MGLFKKKQPYQPTGRTGFIQTGIQGNGMFTGISATVTYEIEELERIGEQSRVKVLDLNGVYSPSFFSVAWAAMDGQLYATNKIIWKETNVQT